MNQLKPLISGSAKSSWLIGVILCLLSFVGCATFNFAPVMSPLKEKEISGTGDDKVLLLSISGIIRNKETKSLTGATLNLGMVEQVKEILEKAEQDDDIRALLIRINSPGGTVTASDIIYHDIKKFKEKTGKKVYVSILDLAASGGYYIAVAGDRIVAHPTSLTGSIGVIALKVNLGDLLNKIGVNWEVIKSGDKKDFLSPLRSLTPEERELFQSTINHFHQRFLSVIAEGRPSMAPEKISQLADGRVYTSDEALRHQLIDKIGYMDDTLDLIKKDLGLSEIKVITYSRIGQYKTNIYSKINQPPTVNLINLNLGLNFDSPSPHFMYLWMN
jgi:protease-4